MRAVYVAERHRDGAATSALRFAGTHPLALIGTGVGYWRYQATSEGVRFLTGYDYRPAWGPLGRLADLAFRPLIGWATAWSFDRLRLWLERGISPATALRRALAVASVRGAVAAAGMAIPSALGFVLAAAALYLPAPPGTPSGLRCRRRPLGAVPAPHTLNRLESPR